MKRLTANGYTFLLNNNGTVEVYGESKGSLEALTPIFIDNKTNIEPGKDFEIEVAYILNDYLNK